MFLILLIENISKYNEETWQFFKILEERKLACCLSFSTILVKPKTVADCVDLLSFLSTQVIKYKLCRCSDKKHKHNSNNDQGTVLSLDDVKCHVSNFH